MLSQILGCKYLVFHADEGNKQLRVLAFHGDDELTIHIGDGTILEALLLHVGTHQWLSVLVGDIARDDLLEIRKLLLGFADDDGLVNNLVV